MQEVYFQWCLSLAGQLFLYWCARFVTSARSSVAYMTLCNRKWSDKTYFMWANPEIPRHVQWDEDTSMWLLAWISYSYKYLETLHNIKFSCHVCQIDGSIVTYIMELWGIISWNYITMWTACDKWCILWTSNAFKLLKVFKT